MADLRECLYHLIVGLEQLDQTKHEISDSLHKGHLLLAKALLLEGQPVPVDIPSLIALLQKPVCEWGVSEIEDYPMDTSLLTQYLGVSSSAKDFLMMYVSPEEAQAQEVLAILQYCRNADSPLEEKYRMIRTYIITNPVVTAIQLISFGQLLQDPNLIDMLNKCYEEITSDSDRYRCCPRCGWTLEYKNNQWRCGTEDLCGTLHNRDQLNKWSTMNKLFRLRPGVYRYTMLPGRAEVGARDYLVSKGYDVALFPNVDQYDLEIKLSTRTVYLDMKDFKNPLILASYFNRMEVHQLAKYLKEHVYVVIPKYRSKLYPGYAHMVVNSLKPYARNIRIVNEREILGLLEEEAG
ncbi:hypothetical protein KP806_18290 [Paenibacillus sp. N4]|uniref:restriction endonuclease-related protein n=1 Tax=Paenibacillus vietnamensis TaxID=2590547 RepID=UPI001CD06357|nr:hypothetical protein [Paenibacillus vietnamensis]MCA0757014.1 hypothetical protein [Paenibacillus vietnamensis]